MRLQHGDIDAALVYAFGKSSLGDIRDVMVLQLDPYYVAPLRKHDCPPPRILKTAPVSREMILNYVAEQDLGLPRSY